MNANPTSSNDYEWIFYADIEIIIKRKHFKEKQWNSFWKNRFKIADSSGSLMWLPKYIFEP